MMSTYVTHRNIKTHSRMTLIFVWMTALIMMACGQSTHEKSELRHVGDPFEVPNSWNICNSEPFDLYLTLAHVDYSNRYWPVQQDPVTGRTIEATSAEIHSWILLPQGTCTDVGPVWKSGLMVLRSKQGAYEVNGGTPAFAGSGVCVNSYITTNKTIPWTAIYEPGVLRPYLSCPYGTALKENFIYSDPPKPQCAKDPNRIDCKITLFGGKIHADGDLHFFEDKKVTEDRILDEKVKDLKEKIETVKGEIIECNAKAAFIKSQKILELDPKAFTRLAAACGESQVLKELKDEVDAIQKEMKDFLLVASQSLDDVYRSVLVIAAKLGVTAPLEDDYKAAAIEELVYPSTSLNPDAQSFYSKLFDKYQEVFDSSYTEDKRRFLTSVLGLTYTLPSFGRILAAKEPLNQEKVLDFKRATDKVEDYFAKVDFNLDGYGYSLDSQVPDDIKITIKNDIKPYAPAQAMALDNELKKWEGALTEKQKLALEAVRFLGKAFHQTVLSLPEDVSAVHARLKSVADGAIEAVKDVTKCIAKVGASGDFADWYEITIGKDYCDGSDISISGRVLSAAGLVVGSAKLWRVMGESVGIAVQTKRVFIDTEEFIDVARGLRFDGDSVRILAKSDAGKILEKLRISGSVKDEEGFKIFNRTVAVTNAFPANGTFARVMPKKYALALKRGEGDFSRIFIDPATGEKVNEAFITAADDLAGLKGGKQVAEKLSLYSDEAGSILRDIGKKVEADMSDVIVTFKFKDDVYTSIRSPIENPNNLRKYGFLPGGKTGGGAREWLIDANSASKGYIDLSSITFQELD